MKSNTQDKPGCASGCPNNSAADCGTLFGTPPRRPPCPHASSPHRAVKTGPSGARCLTRPMISF